MEKVGPEFLRAYADALEVKESLENVDEVRRIPELDQHLLLALSRSQTIWGDRLETMTTANITEWLRLRLVRVTTPDEQSAKLGAFLTNQDPTRYRPALVIGIFPLYHDEVHYTIRPRNPVTFSEHNGRGDRISDHVKLDYFGDEDPLLVSNLAGGPYFLFYRHSPFAQGNPYQSPAFSKDLKYLPTLKPFELSLEENVINRALWLVNVRKRRPNIFKRTGIASFLNSHSSDPRYTELQAAFTQWRPDRKA